MSAVRQPRERETAESVCVKMGRRYVSSLKYREFVRASLGFDAEGSLSVVPIQAGAGVITSLTKADCTPKMAHTLKPT